MGLHVKIVREPRGRVSHGARAPWLVKKALDKYIGQRYSVITAGDISLADISGGVIWALREIKPR